MAYAPTDPNAPEFARCYVNLADAQLGARALAVSDEFFAVAERMLNPEPAVFIAGKYETVPKKMFNELILEVNPTITAVATLLIAFTVLALAAVAFILGRAGKLKQTLV